jgi:hypothetical protein
VEERGGGKSSNCFVSFGFCCFQRSGGWVLRWDYKVIRGSNKLSHQKAGGDFSSSLKLGMADCVVWI